ncbi:NAD(P)-binding protein, partial [Rhizodiscina lignyota]
GICFEFAKKLYDAGCHVLIMDLRVRHDCQAWMDSLPKNGPTKVYFYKASVADWKELEAVFDVYKREIGGTPYLVCPGAGVYEPSFNNFWNDKDKDGHYTLLDINLLAPIKMMRIAIRKMLQADQPGIILHISSIGAQKSSITTPLYQCSKHGISSFTRAMAPLQEWAGIRVVGVAPGVTLSPLFLDHPNAMKFLNRETDYVVMPEEIARGMMAVATEKEKYPPGTILEIAKEWRQVFLLNDPGPRGPGTFTSNRDSVGEEIKAMLRAERGSGSAKL